ncbi:MAG: hypothetical protein FWH41_08905 [Treponema sp.]|nr:hypothetical protein [Treponema sp.]
MKTTNKVFLVGMIGVLLAFGFFLASCKNVFEGKDDTTGKKITLTLKSKSYEIKYDGKTYSGDASVTKSGKTKVYVWTSGGIGGCIVDGKNVTAFSFGSSDLSVAITAMNNLKKSLASGEIYLDDIELIIEE